VENKEAADRGGPKGEETPKQGRHFKSNVYAIQLNRAMRVRSLGRQRGIDGLVD
jgi:hypothetical protein